MKNHKQEVQIFKVDEMIESRVSLPSDKKELKEKLVELIKEGNGQRINEIKYIVSTWDFELEYGSTYYFDENMVEIEDV